MKACLLIALAAALPFTACESLSNPNSALSVLGQQALATGISQVSGRAVSSADLDGAAALIRSLTGKKAAPAPAEVKTAIVSGTAKPSAATTLAAKLSGYISAALLGGANHDKALEVVAVKLNEASAATKAP